MAPHLRFLDTHDLARTNSLSTREASHRNGFQGKQAALPIEGDWPLKAISQKLAKKKIFPSTE